MWDFLACSLTPRRCPDKRKQYRKEKIIAILKEREAGASVPDLSRRHSVAENTIYRWKGTRKTESRAPRLGGTAAAV